MTKKGLHAGKFSVKYKDDPNWWTHSLAACSDCVVGLSLVTWTVVKTFLNTRLFVPNTVHRKIH